MALVATIMGSTAVSTPAHAASVQTWFDIGTGTQSSGNFIWHNRSVQVGGGVTGSSSYLGDRSWWCASVVFTAYDMNNRQVARAARPGDNQYNCTVYRYGFGFMLDASNVLGGIRHIRVDLWEWDRDRNTVYIDKTEWYHRPL
ncbi:hypothetical protein [Plantactinospora mayteni]|uniref:hypothetical protein n=1 Tax=Plantactinospora mayteni TaxID=566021 RepID=UPI0019441139|nr:hypothetical protein [Plantactinospora mayteni]